ncbi:hypothetical protein GGI12_001793 [Dipsacomyces acuminosporus]|nr:hypothetical protein GGI12_001793 [Dipsacomyces acuminosporus]
MLFSSDYLRFTDTTVTKNTSYNELRAMQYVAEHTNINIPKIYSAEETVDKYDTKVVQITMERINGVELSEALDTMDKTKILQNLKQAIQELRSIENPHESYVCSVDGGQVKDYRISWGSPVGPFNDEEEFNDVLLSGTITGHKSVLTHADLKPSNILVDEDCNVYIIDWECCGFYPEYWEYTKSLYLINYYTEWIEAMAWIFGDKFSADLKREKALQALIM